MSGSPKPLVQRLRADATLREMDDQRQEAAAEIDRLSKIISEAINLIYDDLPIRAAWWLEKSQDVFL